MRATALAGVVFAITALASCGRSATEAERIRVTGPAAGIEQSVRPQKTPGQTRLSAQTRSAKADAPLATFTEYDGRRPGAADLARDIDSTGTRRRPAPSDVGKYAGAPRIPRRDIVNLGLDAAPERKSPPPAAENAVAALAVSPAPVPRPAKTATALSTRPTASTAASAAPAPLLPPAPRIGTLSAPPLTAPRGTLDAAPTGLPRFASGGSSVSGIPLGTVPASLGAANIRAAEAAQPATGGLERSTADESGAIGWDEAAALIRAGEIKSYADIGEYELLFTLCSGRGVIAVQPTPGAIFAVDAPKVVCGKEAALIAE